MNSFNMPPGVSASNIPGNSAYDIFFEEFRREVANHINKFGAYPFNEILSDSEFSDLTYIIADFCALKMDEAYRKGYDTKWIEVT